MQSIHKSVLQITALEDMAYRDTILHRLHPVVKLILVLCYVILVVSFPPESVSGLVPFLALPVLGIALGEVPLKLMITRCLLALPFAVLAGLSNLFLNREPILHVGKVIITGGVLSFTALVIKTILTVTAVLLLMATTTMNDLIYAMLSLHIPSLIVIQLMMTYRYLKILLEEAGVMYHAYLLRAPRERGIRMKDLGAFLGNLLLRSIDRAERIYQAMKCRGFEGNISFSRKRRIKFKDGFALIATILLLIVMRLVNISELIGSLWS